MCFDLDVSVQKIMNNEFEQDWRKTNTIGTQQTTLNQIYFLQKFKFKSITKDLNFLCASLLRNALNFQTFSQIKSKEMPNISSFF